MNAVIGVPEQELILARGPAPVVLAQVDDLLAQADDLTPEEQQKLESLREQYSLPELADEDLLDRNPAGALSSPGSAIGVPSAFGASWRNVFAGMTVQERTRFTDRSDGAMSVGFGLGDGEKAVGLEVAIAIVDVAPTVGAQAKRSRRAEIRDRNVRPRSRGVTQQRHQTGTVVLGLRRQATEFEQRREQAQ